MKIEELQHGEATILSPQGPLIGQDAEQLAEHIAKVLGDSRGPIVLDASKVAIVDSRGLEVLADATEQLIRSGRALRLCGVNPTVQEVLELTELADLFEQFEDAESAVEGL